MYGIDLLFDFGWHARNWIAVRAVIEEAQCRSAQLKLRSARTTWDILSLAVHRQHDAALTSPIENADVFEDGLNLLEARKFNTWNVAEGHVFYTGTLLHHAVKNAYVFGVETLLAHADDALTLLEKKDENDRTALELGKENANGNEEIIQLLEDKQISLDLAKETDASRCGAIIENITEKWQCKICIRRHVTTTLARCGHTFCAECIEEVAQHDTRCPVCKTGFAIGDRVRLFFS